MTVTPTVGKPREYLGAEPLKEQANNPSHGVTLEMMVIALFEQYGWSGLAKRIRIRCFEHDPSVKSSLKFLRRTPWARSKVEDLYARSSGSKQSQEN